MAVRNPYQNRAKQLEDIQKRLEKRAYSQQTSQSIGQECLCDNLFFYLDTHLLNGGELAMIDGKLEILPETVIDAGFEILD